MPSEGADGLAQEDEGALDGVEVDNDEGVPSPEQLAKEEQERWRSKAQAANFSFPGKTMVDVYKEARKIDLAYAHARIEHRWADAYYTLHLYLELCMKRGLHKPTETRYEKEGARVLANLGRLEGRLETARKGMLWQLQNAAIQTAQMMAAPALERDDALLSTAPSVAVSIPQAVVATQVLDNETVRAALDALRLTPSVSSSSLLPALAVPIGSASVGSIVTSTAVDSAPHPPPALPPKKKSPGNMTAESAFSNESITTMTLKKVRGDGSCAFRAIAQGEANGALDDDEETLRASELRQTVVRLLRARGGEMMVGTGLTIEQVVLMKDGFTSFNDYLLKMSNSEYAGETEFWLLAEELGVRISVFIYSDEGLEHMITYGAGSARPISLLWQRGQTSELGNHYDSLLET